MPTRALSAAALLPVLLFMSGCAAADSAAARRADLNRIFRELCSAKDTSSRAQQAEEFLRRLALHGEPVATDTSVIIIHEGAAGTVTFAGDPNGWNPAADTLSRIPGTTLSALELPAGRTARFEYKLVADGAWMLDPFNRNRAAGGFGENSEVRMPGYSPAWEPPPGTALVRGRLDTLALRADMLGREVPAIVYVPHTPSPATPLPCIFVTDGVDYLRHAALHLRLDRLIAAGEIPPTAAVFLEPRTGLAEGSPSLRMQEYAMNDTFVGFLVDVAVPAVRERYGAGRTAASTGILGTSLGGLIAAYAALRHPEVFGFCAAQSPAWWWNESALIRLVRSGAPASLRWSITTGTLQDAQDACREMTALLRAQRAVFTYAEHPEGHNWINWRARLDDILRDFHADPP